MSKLLDENQEVKIVLKDMRCFGSFLFVANKLIFITNLEYDIQTLPIKEGIIKMMKDVLDGQISYDRKKEVRDEQ